MKQVGKLLYGQTPRIPRLGKRALLVQQNKLPSQAQGLHQVYLQQTQRFQSSNIIRNYATKKTKSNIDITEKDLYQTEETVGKEEEAAGTTGKKKVQRIKKKVTENQTIDDAAVESEESTQPPAKKRMRRTKKQMEEDRLRISQGLPPIHKQVTDRKRSPSAAATRRRMESDLDLLFSPEENEEEKDVEDAILLANPVQDYSKFYWGDMYTAVHKYNNDRIGRMSFRTTYPSIEVAREAIKIWGLDKMENLHVLQACASPGYLTKALLELDNLKAVIILDYDVPFIKRLRNKYYNDKRVYAIENYPNALFDIEKFIPSALLPKCNDWNQVHPNLFMTVQAADNRVQELFLHKMIMSSLWRVWVYRYGRVRMGILGTQDYRMRLSAPPGSQSYRTISVTRRLLTNLELSATAICPGPPRRDNASLLFRTGAENVCDLFTVTPVKDSPITEYLEYTYIDFTIMMMMILPGLPWHQSLKNVGPGTEVIPELLSKRGINIEPSRLTRDVTPKEFLEIGREVYQWPFKPTIHDVMHNRAS